MSQEILRKLSSGSYELHGIEIFPGIGTPFSYTNRYGAIFVASGEGRPHLTFVGWVNYTPIFFKPETVCSIIGGRWLLISRESRRCRGMLQGYFSEGEVQWNKNAKLARVSARLKLSGSRDLGTLSAILNHFPFPPKPPRIEGLLNINYT